MQRHVWASDTLEAQGFVFDTRRLHHARQALPCGYIELHKQGILTMAWHASSHWRYWRIYPDPVVATLTDVVCHTLIPDVEEDPKPIQTPCRDPIPRDAAHTLRIALRWTYRLHAHTPIGTWDDMHVANGARQWFAGTALYIRALAIAFSAPPQQPPDFELRVYSVHQVDQAWQRDRVLVRVDRARKAVTVQHDQARASQQHRFVQRIKLDPVQFMLRTDVTHAFDRWVVHQALRMHRCADTLLAQHNALSSMSHLPKPLSPDRRRALTEREKAWYMRGPGPWPYSRARAQSSLACREAAKQPRS